MNPGAMRFRLRGNVSVMHWGCISFLAFVTLVVVDGNVAQYSYIDLMGGNLLESVEQMLTHAATTICAPTRQCSLSQSYGGVGMV